MNEQTKTPIELLTALLAEMTERAIAAERERDAKKKEAEEWYKRWQERTAALRDTELKLSAERDEHNVTRKALKELLSQQECYELECDPPGEE